MGATAADPIVPTYAVRLGVSIPGSVGPDSRSLEWTLAGCRALGIVVVDVAIDALERVLGAPVPTVPLEPPTPDALAFGLLELEEDVLRDSYELAKRTFDAQMQAWRSTVSLAPLDDLHRAWRDAGISLEIVQVPDLVLWSDEEVDYACRVTRAVGARTLTTRASLAGPRRLAPAARRHNLRLSFMNDHTTGTADLGRIAQHDASLAVAIDVAAWISGGLGSLELFLKDHASRISHVRLKNEEKALVAEVLRLMRDHTWTFPAILAIEGTGDAWLSAVSDILDDCRATLA
jgi:hypothetical protein